MLPFLQSNGARAMVCETLRSIGGEVCRMALAPFGIGRRRLPLPVRLSAPANSLGAEVR